MGGRGAASDDGSRWVRPMGSTFHLEYNSEWEVEAVLAWCVVENQGCALAVTLQLPLSDLKTDLFQLDSI